MLIKLILQFYLTFLIPLLYLYNILLIAKTPNSVEANIYLRLLGLTLACFGLIFWVLSMVNLRKHFGVLPRKQKRVKSGLYKYFRHPMYIGIWLTFVGLSIGNASWQGLVFTNLFMTPLLFIRAYFEDKNLTD